MKKKQSKGFKGKKKQSKGFIIVASKKHAFYRYAKLLAESVRDFWPEANITFFTERDWVQEEDYELFDIIIKDDVPSHIRTKLWALNKTPYDITCYLDADMMCMHEDIVNVFDQLPDDKDIVFTKNRPYNAKLTKLSNTEEMTCHCGFFIYRKTLAMMDLMGAWWTEYLKQWEPDYDIAHYPKDAIKWDTFTMWRLLTYGGHDINWGYIKEPDARWNFINGYTPDELKGTEIVLYHHTIPKEELER